MKREIYSELLKWKNDPDRRPLIMEGARQTGKTWIVKEFGRNEYDNMVYINCDNNADIEKVFVDYDMERILRVLSAMSGEDIIPGKTLVFLDEIQEVDRGIASLKYFCENARDIHVIVAGSLLGISVHEGTGFPVGKVDSIKLYPMSFIEFLMAIGEGKTVDLFRSRRWNEISMLSNKLTELLRQYYYVGGMPAVVSAYASDKDINKVRKIQDGILSDYRRDFSKHVPANELSKVNMVWDSVLPQLAKENKKFIYGVLKQGARARDYEVAIQWLIDAGLVYKIERINKLDMPVNFYKDRTAFKLYILDVGLLGAMAHTGADKILVGNNGFKEYKGALTENYVAQEYMAAAGRELFYYVNDRASVEIDFVMESDRVYPVEVKAETNLKSKSLKSVLDKYPDSTGWRFSMNDFKEQERITNIPLYLAGEWISAYATSIN